MAAEPDRNHTPTARYAVYFAPLAFGPWWQAGSRWLGRCAASGAAQLQPTLDGVRADVQRQLTAEPRRYGWHATLKAPFRLAEGRAQGDLHQALDDLARAFEPFDLPHQRPQPLDAFLALLPDDDCPMLNALANACVTELDSLRAPLNADELARRRRATLTARQDALLTQWGYPYVLDEFHFHCSLTGDWRSASPELRQAVQDGATSWFDPLPPCRVGHLSLFEESQPGAEFRMLRQWPLGVRT